MLRFGLNEPNLGVAVKIEDGNPRGMPCVLLSALERLGAMTPKIDRSVGSSRSIDQTNSVGGVIGQIRAANWASSAAPAGESASR